MEEKHTLLSFKMESCITFKIFCLGGQKAVKQDEYLSIRIQTNKTHHVQIVHSVSRRTVAGKRKRSAITGEIWILT